VKCGRFRHLRPPMRESALMERFRFGRFELDLEAQELRRAGQPVKLQTRPFRILALLVSRAGTVVTREEIRDHVWGSDTWVDFDHNVSFCVHQIRLALQDRAARPTFVETLPRRGYRFVAPVETSASRVGRPTSFTSARPQRRLPAVAAVAILGFLTLGIVFERDRPRLPAPLPPSPAQEAYRRGEYLRLSGEPRLTQAADALQSAVGLDPDDAAARVALAETYVALADLGLRPSSSTLALAEAQAREALRRDASLARAHVVLGTARLAAAWDWQGARASLERAVALDPRLVSAHTAWAAYLSARGDQEGALRAIRRAEALDPVCPTLRGEAGWYLYCARRFADAASEWQKAVALEPWQAGGHERLVRAYRHAARLADAEEEARRTMRLVGAGRDVERVDLALFSKGTARWLETSPAAGPDALERRAALYASVGDRERALSALETACTGRSRYLLRYLAVDPDFDALARDARYRALLRRVGLEG
jgi:DNA-binding winged helix-turn-helix (wHTH) protein/Flp pilus assembly protein TadD